jgi:single-stranded DNA-binding protein
MNRHEASFNISGTVGRKPYVGNSQSGDYCFFSVKVEGEKGANYFDIAVFGAAVEDASRLAAGADVRVSGVIRSRAIKGATTGEGKPVWGPQFVAEKIASVLAAEPRREQRGRQQEEIRTRQSSPPEDDDIPF